MAQSEHLSPPQIHKPVYDCAEVVKVSGFTAGAIVEIFANGNELIGSAKPFVGWWHIRTNRPLNSNDSLTAIQKVGSDESFPTPQPVPVENLPGAKIDPLSEPQVAEPIYHCQQVVEATAVLSGAWVEVAEHPSNEAPLIGSGTTPTDTVRIGAPRLNKGQELYARQVVCGRIKSRFTPPVQVQPLPPKLAEPSIREDSLIVGSKIIVVDGLVTGAEVNVIAGNQRIAGGIASSGSTIFPTTETIKANVKYWAEQSLCELKSDPPVDGGIEALRELSEPQLRVPICPGSSSIIVENTVLGALVKVFVNGKQWGQVTAISKETLVQLGDKHYFTSNDSVMATQEVGPTGPVKSATEMVSLAGVRGEPRILGGHPFFTAAPGEQPIPGPVFLRGRRTPAGPGPVFNIVACGAERVNLTIHCPADTDSFPVELIEGPGGHYTGVWDWVSTSINPANSIYVGKYIARFTVAGAGGTKIEECPFFVIFDPAEVSASPRFTFDHTGVWFGTGNGSLQAYSYHLHPSDYRVFGWAMNIIDGQLDSWNSAQLLLQAEHQKFKYALTYHGNDVIRLLEHETTAQCADDANVLTALLRASGIPAHPVTIDARLEFGDARWTFDTWVEARLVGSNGERWYALHSHQLGSAKGPVTRRQAGLGWGEAHRSSNDMVVMAAANWKSTEIDDTISDVTYDWDTPCKRPSKNVAAKSWITNLSDDRPDSYWPKPFWECSPAYVTPIHITLATDRFMAGDVLSGTVEIHNNSQRVLMGELSLMLAESNMDTKVFADRLNPILTHEIRLPLDEQISIPFQVRLPSTVCADNEVSIVANLGDARVIAHVKVTPSFILEPNVPSTVQIGETFPLQIRVTNGLDRVLTGAIFEIELPFACRVEMPISTRTRDHTHRDFQSIPPVEPGAATTVEWLLRAVSPAAPAAIRIKASAPGFGERRISIATTIPDLRPLDYIDPIVPPTYAHQFEID